jgi:putative glycosyltransferase (TIGR04372 family)
MKAKIFLLLRYLFLSTQSKFIKFFNKKLTKSYLIKLYKIKKKLFNNLSETTKFINILKNNYPEDFQINYLHAMNTFEHCNSKFSILLNKSWKLRQTWLYKNKLEKYDTGNVDKSTVIGSLGNHFYLSNWLQAINLKLNNYKKTEIILNEKDNLSNLELFKYFKPSVKVIYENKLSKKEREIKEVIKIPLCYALPIRNDLIQIHIATNILNNKKKNKDIKSSVFRLLNAHKKIGYSYLKKKGLNKNDWFITLHVREGGTKNDHDSESFRNSNINSYLNAIKFVTDRGGYVFRMGDKNMSNLPNLKNVINYASSNEKSQALDIFLGAKSKFCIATSSGYYIIPYLFGVPILMTNTISTLDYWLLREGDYLLPRKIYCEKTKKNLKLNKSLNLPYAIISNNLDYHLKNLRIKIIPNTSEEICDSVKEMFESVINKNTIKNDKLNQNFQKIMNKSMLNYTSLKLNALAKIPKKFLQKHF